MSIKRILQERGGQRVQLQAVDRVPSGSSARVRLVLAGTEAADTPGAARALIRRHVPTMAAHRAMTRLLDQGEALLVVPSVEDWEALVAELARHGVRATHHEPPHDVDVRSIRQGLGVSQEDFALRFGLDLATLRNWEQGRSRPDYASRTMLSLIAANPDLVSKALIREAWVD